MVQSVYQYGRGRHRQATGLLGVHPSLRAGASSGPVVACVLASFRACVEFAVVEKRGSLPVLRSELALEHSTVFLEVDERAGPRMDAFEARLMSSEAAKVDVVPGFTASHHGDAGGDLRHRANAGGRHGRIQGTSRSYTVPGSPPLSMLWGLADSCGELGRRRDVARELRACQADNHIYTMEAHAQLPVGAGRSVGQAPSTPPVRPRVLPR
eukprot:s3242_g3.t2